MLSADFCDYISDLTFSKEMKVIVIIWLMWLTSLQSDNI